MIMAVPGEICMLPNPVGPSPQLARSSTGTGSGISPAAAVVNSPVRRLSFHQAISDANEEAANRLTDSVHKPIAKAKIKPGSRLSQAEAPKAPIPQLQLASPSSSPRGRSSSLSDRSSSHILSSSPSSLSSTASSPCVPSPLVGVSPERPSVIPKSIFTQLIDASLIHDTHAGSPRDTMLSHEGFLFTYLWFGKTTTMLTELRSCFHSDAYQENQKENMMRFAIRLCTAAKIVPWNDEEKAHLRALAQEASGSPKEKLQFKGQQLAFLLDEAAKIALPNVPAAASSNKPHYQDLKDAISQRSSLDSKMYKENVKAMAMELHNLNLAHLKSIRFDEFWRDHRKDNYPGAPSCKAAVEFFNQLSWFVPHEILLPQFRDAATRTRMYEFFIDLAWKLYKLDDFNCLMALVTGLGFNCLDRLKQMRSAVDKKHQHRLQEMQSCISPIGGFKVLRARMEEAEKRKKFEALYSFIPYLGLLELDITRIEESYDFKTPSVNLNAVINLAVPIERFFHSMRLCKPLPCASTGFLDHFTLWKSKFLQVSVEHLFMSKSMAIEPPPPKKESAPTTAP